jgi:hypothetical protein
MNTEATSDSWQNTSIPNSTNPVASLAMFWDDLSPDDSGAIYYYADTANNRFIVEFSGIAHYNDPTASYTFEAILYPDGRIVYQYNTMANTNRNYTIGIQNPSGTDGLQLAYNSTTFISDGRAFELVIPETVDDWLTIAPASGSIIPGGNQAITLTANPTNPVIGDYTCTVTLYTNDPNHTVYTIPVTLHVTEYAAAPAIPQNLLVHIVGNTAHLTWDAVTEDINGNPVTDVFYYIYRANVTMEISTVDVFDLATTNEYTDTTASGGSFRYYVTAVSGEDVRAMRALHNKTRETQKK